MESSILKFSLQNKESEYIIWKRAEEERRSSSIKHESVKRLLMESTYDCECNKLYRWMLKNSIYIYELP